MTILKTILYILTRLTLLRYKPKIVGITGSVGKTSAKEAIALVLSEKYRVRQSIGNYNNEIGLPLSVLNGKNPERNIFGWIVLFFKSLGNLIYCTYPEILVLEMGADRPGDVTYLNKLVGQLEFAVITDIGISHMEFYPSEQALIKEKFTITKALAKGSVIALNFDSKKIYENRNLAKSEILGFGFHKEASIVASDFQILEHDNGWGVNFKVHYKGTVVPFFIPGVVGKPVVYAGLSAIATGLHFDLNLVNASQSLQKYQAPPGRLRVIEGIKHTLILDDTYNAAPDSTVAALETLKLMATSRKLACIGPMAELGKTEEEGLKLIAAKIVETTVEIVFLVGKQAENIKNSLVQRKFKGNFFVFNNADEARISVQNELRQGDLVLVKGSQAGRMEKIVMEIMVQPLNASKLLVRQSKSWINP